MFDSEGNTVGENFGVTWWDIIGLGLFTLVTRTTSSMIKDTVGQGLRPEYTLDIFCINLFSQFLLSFTRYGWYIYGLIPAYLCYKLSGYAWAYIARTNSADSTVGAEMDPKMAKKLAK